MEEKRSIEGYEITHAVHIGDREVVFGENKSVDAENQFLCAYCTTNELFRSYEEGMTGSYLEIMKLFSERVQAQVVQVEKDLNKFPAPLEPITAEQCYPNDLTQSIEGKVVAIKEEALRPEYRTASHQLEFVLGGFGANENARGSAVICRNLYSGKESRWERYDVQGGVRPEHLPGWAKKSLEQIQNKTPERQKKQAEKEER